MVLSGFMPMVAWIWYGGMVQVSVPNWGWAWCCSLSCALLILPGIHQAAAGRWGPSVCRAKLDLAVCSGLIGVFQKVRCL